LPLNGQLIRNEVKDLDLHISLHKMGTSDVHTYQKIARSDIESQSDAEEDEDEDASHYTYRTTPTDVLMVVAGVMLTITMWLVVRTHTSDMPCDDSGDWY